MTVYFVEMEGENRIKIGYTAGSAERRMAQLQTGQPQKLRLLGTIPGERDAEQGLHKEFKAYRGNGEWFFADAEVRAAIQTVIDGQLPWYHAKGPRLLRDKMERMETAWVDAFSPMSGMDQSSFDCSFDITKGESKEDRRKKLRALGSEIRKKTGVFPPWVLREIAKTSVSENSKYISSWNGVSAN
jgi:T5orf172 domain